MRTESRSCWIMSSPLRTNSQPNHFNISCCREWSRAQSTSLRSCELDNGSTFILLIDNVLQRINSNLCLYLRWHVLLQRNSQCWCAIHGTSPIRPWSFLARFWVWDSVYVRSKSSLVLATEMQISCSRPSSGGPPSAERFPVRLCSSPDSVENATSIFTSGDTSTAPKSTLDPSKRAWIMWPYR